MRDKVDIGCTPQSDELDKYVPHTEVDPQIIFAKLSLPSVLAKCFAFFSF